MVDEESYLKRAIIAFERTAVTVKGDAVMSKLDANAKYIMRLGVVYHYNRLYDVCRAQIEKSLSRDLGREALGLPYRDMYRCAGQRKLIDRVEPWFSYHEERNRTTHPTDEELLSFVNATVPAFIEMQNRS